LRPWLTSGLSSNIIAKKLLWRDPTRCGCGQESETGKLHH
jgi:hypothetical protein